MERFAFRTIPESSYWSTWAVSICMHTAMVGVALFLSDQIPTPQKVDRNPVAISFFTPQPTQTTPTRRPTVKKPPPKPTTQTKLTQPEAIPREPTQSKPHRQLQKRQTAVPQKIVQPSPKSAPQPIPQLTNVTTTPVAQPKTVGHAQTMHQPTVRNSEVSSQAIARTVGSPLPRAVGHTTGKPMPRVAGHTIGKPVPRAVGQAIGKPVPRVVGHAIGKPAPRAVVQRTSITRQHETPKIQTSTSRRKPIHVNTTTARVESVQHSTHNNSHTAVRHAYSKPVRQPVSLSSGNPVVRTHTAMSYTRQMKKSRPATNTRAATGSGFSPELLAFSKLLREKIARTLEFPRLAKRLGYSGTTHVELALSKTGIVRDLKVSKPSGHDILDKAAILTLKKVLQTTKPPESITIEQLVIPIAFNLKRH